MQREIESDGIERRSLVLSMTTGWRDGFRHLCDALQGV